MVDKLAKIQVGRRNNVTCITDDAYVALDKLNGKNLGGISGQLSR